MSETIINRRQIHWFPGHMAKTLRLMETEIRHVDCVLQVLDARIPLSSLNPEIERITAGKPHLYVLNKADLADPAITRQWLEYFRSAGEGCLPMDSKQKGRANAVRAPIEQVLLEIPAGKLDAPDEDRLLAAKRELHEETGLVANRWDHLTDIVTTPGFSNEKISLYLARDLRRGEAAPDEDEFLNLVRMPFAEAVAAAVRGELADAKTICALLLAAERMRSGL